MGLRQVAISALALALLFTPSHAVVLKSGGAAAGVSFGTWEPLNWTPDFVAVYRIENSSDLGENESLTSCGSDCDLTGTNVSSSTSDPIEGLRYLDPDSAAADVSMSCDADGSGCTALDINTGNLTWGGWVNYRGDNVHIGGVNNNMVVIGQYDLNSEGTSDDTGYAMTTAAFGAPAVSCFVDDTQLQITNVTGTSTTTDPGFNAWYHFVCRYTADSELELIKNDTVEATTTSGLSMSAADSDFFAPSTYGVNTGGLNWEADELFVYAGLLTDKDICRICSCGINGEGCSCSASSNTSYVSTGVNSSNCGSCTLPDCNGELGAS